MSGDGSKADKLAKLKERLEFFDAQLKELLTSTQSDLAIAEQIQKKLMGNRTPSLQGLEVLARYIGAQQLSSECFDLLPTRDQRQLWIVHSWTETFGLSSLLLQVLMRLQSQALVEREVHMNPDEVFNELSLGLCEAQRKGDYALRVVCLDMSTLVLRGCSIGMGPLLLRQKETQHWKRIEILQEDTYSKNPKYLLRGNSAHPALAAQACVLHKQLEAGSRLHLVGRDWNAAASDLQSFLRPLELDMLPETSASLLDELNHLTHQAEQFTKKGKAKADISAISLEIDPKKLHLA